MQSHRPACIPAAPNGLTAVKSPVAAGPKKFEFPRTATDLEAAIAPSIVHVRFTMPYSVDSIQGGRYAGTGLVVDAERGLVVVDRNTVSSALGDISVSFANSVEVPATAEYVVPLPNSRIRPPSLIKMAIKAPKLKY